MLLVGASAASADVVARIEAGVAQPVSSPARDYYAAGATLAGAAGIDLLPFLEVGGRVSYTLVSKNPSSPFESPASLITLGPLLRLHRPREAGWVPFGELSLQYVRTGPLDRLGLALSAGVHFKLGPIVLGPWAGVQQVFRLADAADYPTRDATVFLGGASLELGLSSTHDGHEARPPADAPARAEPTAKPAAEPDADHDDVKLPADRCPGLAEDKDGFEDDDGCPDPDDDGDGVLDGDDACPRLPGTAATLGCPDTDLDSVADTDDQCPTVRGDRADRGCPLYRDVKVLPTRLELARPLDFARGEARIPPRSAPMLDEAARALLDRGLCVRAEGHGDERGKPSANQTLATQRAEAVRLHLLGKGVSPSRLTAHGFGALAPFGDVELVLVPCEVKAP